MIFFFYVERYIYGRPISGIKRKLISCKMCHFSCRCLDLVLWVLCSQTNPLFFSYESFHRPCKCSFYIWRKKKTWQDGRNSFDKNILFTKLLKIVKIFQIYLQSFNNQINRKFLWIKTSKCCFRILPFSNPIKQMVIKCLY